MRKEERPGKYGYHRKLEQIIAFVKEQDRGVTFPEINEHFANISSGSLEQILMQAEGLGMIEPSYQGGGSTRRFFYTPNKQVYINDHRNDKIVTQIRALLNDLKEEGLEDGKGVQISIQVTKENE